MKGILLTTVFVVALSTAQAEEVQKDPKDLVADLAGHYAKDFKIPLPKVLDIDLPKELDIGWRNTDYRFDGGAVMSFKTRDPLNQIDIRYGNQNYQINQDGVTWTYSKTLTSGWWN